jgi:hypothetical protein
LFRFFTKRSWRVWVNNIGGKLFSDQWLAESRFTRTADRSKSPPDGHFRRCGMLAEIPARASGYKRCPHCGIASAKAPSCEVKALSISAAAFNWTQVRMIRMMPQAMEEVVFRARQPGVPAVNLGKPGDFV